MTDTPQQGWTALRQKSKLYRNIRQYFDTAGFLEVETPILTPSPIPESHIELFATDLIDKAGTSHRLFLIPSPEVWMKHLLAMGYPSLYQICRCFRNGEQTDTWHRWEFTMLEWYEIGIDATENIKRMQELFALVHQSKGPDFRIMTMNQVFEEFAGFSLEKDLQNIDLSTIFSRRLAERNLPVGDENDTPDDLFHRLFITLVEDKLPTDKPLILKDWPALVPTLAKNIPGTPWADRWEMYYRGVEIANCYSEENDRLILQEYWKDQAPKKESSRVPMIADEKWPLMIADTMPKCSGTAVGLDRLLALIRGDESLHGLDIFPIHDMMPDIRNKSWE